MEVIRMKVRFFALDHSQQLRKVRHPVVRRLLAGRAGADALGCPAGGLPLATVVCDDELWPRAVYLLRVPLTGGRFTPADGLTLRAFGAPDCVTPAEAARHHGAGWPADLVRQLAVALDVPVAGLAVPFGVGARCSRPSSIGCRSAGPSAGSGTPPAQAARTRPHVVVRTASARPTPGEAAGITGRAG
jgi:hypothetical protein